MSDNTAVPRNAPARRPATNASMSKSASTGSASSRTKTASAAAPKADAPRVSPYAGFTPLSPSDEKLWAALIQLGGLAFYFVAPLVGYLLLRQRGPFVREHAVAALNWQLSVLIYYFVSYILILAVIGIPLMIAVAVVNVVFSILAAMHAHRGQLYVYPLAIKFLRA